MNTSGGTPSSTSPRAVAKAEPRVERRTADQRAAAPVHSLEAREPLSDQRRANALSLRIGSDGYWPQAIPVGCPIRENDWGKRHVTDEDVVHLDHQREGQRVRAA